VFAEEELEACWRYLIRWLSLKISNSSFFGFIAKNFLWLKWGFQREKDTSCLNAEAA
jgi:hypothetical protein